LRQPLFCATLAPASRPIVEQPLHSASGITICDDAWPGYGVIVLDGVTIGAGAVEGADAVVVRDVLAGAIAVGVPARIPQAGTNCVFCFAEHPERSGGAVPAT